MKPHLLATITLPLNHVGEMLDIPATVVVGLLPPPPLQSDLAGRCSLLTKLFVYVFSIAVCHYLIPIVSYSGLRWTK